MSLHALANHMATKGRNGDSMLVHMTPGEVAGLHALALKHGGELTTNPDTGLPEASFLKSLLPMLAGAALNFFVPGLGAAVGGAFGLGAAAGTGIAVGGITSLATGSLSRGLMAGLGAYGGAGMVEGLSSLGAGELAQGQISANMPTLAEGATESQIADYTQQVKDLRTAGMQGASGLPAADKLSAGFSSATASPTDALQFAKQNWAPLAAAAGPIAADMMVPTTTKMPDISSNADIRQSIYDPYSGTYRHLNPVPAKNYGTPAWSPYKSAANGGSVGEGIVALAGGGVPRYGGAGTSLIKEADLKNIYANLGGEKAFDTIATNYLGSGGDDAGLASIMSKYATAPTAAPAVIAPAAAAPAGLTPQQQAAMALMFKSSTGGVDTAAMDALGGADAVRRLATAGGFDGSATGLYDYAAKTPGAIDWKSKAGEQLASNYVTARDAKVFTDKFKTPADQALELMYRATTVGGPTSAFDSLGGYSKAKQIATAAGFDATPEWQAEYEKKMGYPVVSRLSTAATIAADKAASDKATSGLTALNRVDAGADTRLDYTGDGTSTVKPVSVASTGTYKTVAGDTSVAPAIGTAVGQGTYQGTGTMASTGTQGPIVDFTGKTAFTSNPLTLAKQQIADQSAAKTAADKLKLDLYSQWGASNPKATELEHVNFIDKIGLPPETAAQLLNISPDKAKDMYYNAKFNQQTGDSLAAYNYLMGKGANPTKSGVGEIMRPYAEATLGMPANTNRKYVYDQATGKYNLNPDYVAEYKDPSGGTNYLMSQKEIFNYFKANAGQDDATTYAWAVENNLTPQEISQATGVPLSQITPKWRAAAANKAAVTNKDGTIDQVKLDQQIKDGWDEAAYLAANPDVAAEMAAGKSTFKTGYDHYLAYGKAEGRKPTTKGGVVVASNASSSNKQVSENDTRESGGAAGGGLMGYAMGGMPMYAVGGGLGALGSYSDGGRLLKGPGDGVSDSIPATIGQKQQPARLADGEFVVPARIVSELGNGSTDAGAKKLYAMMDRVQRARGKTTGKNKVAANSRADKYLPA